MEKENHQKHMVQQLATEFVCLVVTPDDAAGVGCGMLLKIQHTLVNVFVVLKQTSILMGLLLCKTGFTSLCMSHIDLR